MSNKVQLAVTGGPLKGKEFSFEEHDTFLFGRLDDCHCRLPDDIQISRRHFLIEVNPPDARIRDFGSLNGTYVNEKKIGSRSPGETPEQGQKRAYPEIDLKNGDIITVGRTTMSVEIKVAQAAESAHCARCGKDVAGEAGGRRKGDYICAACRQSMAVDPAQVLLDMLAQGREEPAGGKDKYPMVAGYRIKRRLGLGGFGAVYRAEREKDGQPAAIKVMLSQVAVDEMSRRKFQQEIALLCGLRHRNIVALRDSGSAGGAFYFVMEFCPGGSVADYMDGQGGTLAPSIALPIMIQALEGLAYAHGKGIVHRDLKPSNILLSGTPAEPVAKIADLGLAKNFDRAGFSGMTVTGHFAGTPSYMPKEQILNFKYTRPVTDVWSIGASFYNMLTGFIPRDFSRDEDPIEVVLRGEIVPIGRRRAGVPRSLAAVIDKAIQPNPQDRYQDAMEMLSAMKRVKL